MKKISLILFIISITYTADAQKIYTFKPGIGGELGVVTGNLNKTHSFAAGATGQLDYNVDTDLAITANAGIIQLIGKKINSTIKNRSITFVPLLAGIKYYFTPLIYGSGQLGTSIDVSKNGGSIFTYIPGIGFKIDNNLDALVKYTGYKDSGGTIGVRLGYTF